MKKVIVVLVCSLLIAKGLSAQTITVDPALTAAVVAQTVIENNNADDIKDNQNTIKKAQAAITAASALINSWQKKIYTGLTEVNNNVKNAFQFVEAGKTVISIGDYQAKMISAAQPNPLALAFAAKIETNLLIRASKCLLMIKEVAIKSGDTKILMDAGERVQMMNDILLELRILEAMSASAYYKVQLVVRQGIIKSLNPFGGMYNNDKALVKEILNRAKF